jgi:hypothetical protein
MCSDAPETVYVNHEDHFSVVRQRGTPDRYFLDVLCGGIGMFERRIEMTPEEIEMFRTNPQDLRVLALKVNKWPERFTERMTPR